jgi:OmpA-OmpF porin, OOP family
MTTNLISQLSREFGGDAINKIAGALGEDTSRTQAAMDGTLQALVGGLVNKSSTRDGASDLLDLLKRNNLDGTRFTNVASAISGPDGISRMIETGGPLLNSVLGSRANSVIDWVTSLGGIKKSSSTSLLSLALPVVLGQIGRLVSSGGWNVSNLMNLMSDQKSYLRNMPTGLTNALGYGGAEWTGPGPERERRATPSYVSEPIRREREGSTWWKWALPLLALLALGWLLSRLFTGRERQVQTNIAVPTATAPYRPEATPTMRAEAPATVPPATAPARTDLGAFVEKRLPDGTTLRIPANGVESKLLVFIEDPTRRVDRETWFTFDRLEFETDSANLRPGSAEQLRNIAEILKAYPNVNVKIGGYTDNVGDASYNLRLSQERANRTMNELEKLGVSSSRITAEGFGAQHPVADNSTEEGRQRNRRIDIRVTKK